MKLSFKVIFTVLISGCFWYFMLPAFNLTDYTFWIWLFVTFATYVLSNVSIDSLTFDGVSEKKASAYVISALIATVVALFVFIILPFASSRVFHAKGFSNLVKVENKDFNKDFPETDINKLALLDRQSAEKIGNSYLGNIDKVSQFEVSDEYRQITIKDEPYRVSPLNYASMIRWWNNRKDGIGYYVKVNQTTGKAELVKLKQNMKYSTSSYFNDDVLRKLRFKYSTILFSDPSFEVDDEGNPWYVATTYVKKVSIFGPKDPNGVVLFNPVDGSSKKYALKDVPKWVDRVYGADATLTRINWHYGLKNGFWNTIFSKIDIKQTTDDYNYISIGSDIYMYTGLTSNNSDTSNLGFVLTNMRTRETSFYKLPSATESSAKKSAEGAIQEKGYKSTSPILVKLKGQSYYLSSLKDKGKLVKAYALVNAEDIQQVKVSTNINELISSVTGDTIDGIADETERKSSEKIEGVIESVKTQIVDGTTIYYLKVNGSVYKIKAQADNLDQLPFIENGQTVSGYKTKNNYLESVEIK